MDITGNNYAEWNKPVPKREKKRLFSLSRITNTQDTKKCLYKCKSDIFGSAYCVEPLFILLKFIKLSCCCCTLLFSTCAVIFISCSIDSMKWNECMQL